MTEPPDPLDMAHTNALVGELRRLIGKLKRRLRDQASPGKLTWSQVAVLGHLMREGGVTVSALARAENMRPQSMGAIVAALEAAGLVSGAPDPDDGRKTLLSLTAHGHAWIQANRAARDDWLVQTIRSRLSAEERQELARCVALLQRLVEP
jgi:DNA-binding MarR family transcriptional regulator